MSDDAHQLLDTELITGVHTLSGRGGMEFSLTHHWQVALPLLRAMVP